MHIWQPEMMSHPVAVTEPVRPADLTGHGWALIDSGAVTAGGRGDALVRLNHHEIARRAEHGLGAVTNYALLGALLNLPLDTPVRMSTLSVHDMVTLGEAPPGVIDVDAAGWVTRRLAAPLTVSAAIVEGTGWRNITRRAARFLPFCQQIALFPCAPKGFSSVAWEASFAGIGVWIRDCEDITEAVCARPYVRRFWKAAGWEFQEIAYREHLKATRPAVLSGGPAGRRARTTRAASDPRQLSLL